MKNQRGQMTIEIVLMTAVVVFAAVMVSKGFRDNEIFSGLVTGPWQRLSGMIQNGVWSAPNASMPIHPNSYLRVSSVKAEVVTRK